MLDGSSRFPRKVRTSCYHSNINTFLRPVEYFNLGTRISNLLTLILLQELPNLTHIGHKLLKVSAQDWWLNFFPQVKTFSGSMAEILMEFTIFQTTFYIMVLSNWLGRAKYTRISDLVKNLLWRLIQGIKRVISGFLLRFPLFWRWRLNMLRYAGYIKNIQPSPTWGWMRWAVYPGCSRGCIRCLGFLWFLFAFLDFFFVFIPL